MAPLPQRASVTLHRARNDLQVLTSLMALQADHTEDPAARAALLASRDRLAAVALIYRLIEHENDAVDFARFTQEIAHTLFTAHRRPEGHILIEPLFTGIVLPQRLAISLGLIVEELIAASLIHAFPEETDRGLIRITLTVSGNEGVLILRDNGHPFTEAQRNLRDAGFSHRIVQLLAGQIDGTLTYLTALENQVRLRFTVPAGD